MKKKDYNFSSYYCNFALVIVTSCFIGLVNISTIKDAKENISNI